MSGMRTKGSKAPALTVRQRKARTKCMICGKKIDEGATVCSSCFEEARNPPDCIPVPEDACWGFQYKRKEWRLIGANCVTHVLGVAFEIGPSPNGLTERLLRVETYLLEDDVTELSALAVTAYLDLIGWDKPARPKQGSKGSFPKPN